MSLLLFKRLFLIFYCNYSIFQNSFSPGFLSLFPFCSPRGLADAVTANPSHVTYSLVVPWTPPLCSPRPAGPPGLSSYSLCWPSAAATAASWAAAGIQMASSHAWNRAFLVSGSGYATSLLPWKHFKLRKQIHSFPLLHIPSLRTHISPRRLGPRWRTLSLSSGCYCQRGQRCARNCNCSCKDCFLYCMIWLIFKWLVLLLLKHCMCIHAFLLSWRYTQMSNSIIIFKDKLHCF